MKKYKNMILLAGACLVAFGIGFVAVRYLPHRPILPWTKAYRQTKTERILQVCH